LGHALPAAAVAASRAGWSPIKAGAVIAIMTIGSMLARFGGTYTIRKLGFKNALIITAGLTAVFTAAPAVFDIDTSYVLILGSLLAVGFFRAAHYVASTAIAFAEVRPEEVSRASTLSTVIQQLSLSFGISFAGLTLYASAGRSSHFTAAQFILPFVSLGLVAALAVPVYTRLAAQAGHTCGTLEGITMNLNDESRAAADTPGGAPLAPSEMGVS